MTPRTYCANNACDLYRQCADSLVNSPWEKIGVAWVHKGHAEQLAPNLPPFILRWRQPDLDDCFRGMGK